MNFKKKNQNISTESALSKVMFICSRQEKCCNEIRKKLQDWNISCEDQDDIIQSLLNEKFINEERYTDFYVRDKFKFNKWGRIKIVHHLQQKQIPETIIAKAIEQIDENEYLESLNRILLSKLKSTQQDDLHQLKIKLYRFAKGRGFESQIVLKQIDHLLSEKK